MADNGTKATSLRDAVIRIVVPGILIAFTGLVGECAMSKFSSNQENARLVTNLQVQREQAESVLRKDIFNQALKALLTSSESKSGLDGFSNRLLKLELLALNFGDSLSLSPFFAEFERELKLADAPGGPLEVQIGQYRKRLRSLARRVASTQTSSLVLHGFELQIKVPLTDHGRRLAGPGAYRWPEAEVEIYLPKLTNSDDPKPFLQEMKRTVRERIGHERYLVIEVSDPDLQEMEVRVHFQVCRPEKVLTSGDCVDDEDTVSKKFTLDLFNFPKIDNTRLSDNQRMSLVLEEFPYEDKTGKLLIQVLFFPSEYASLRDRPSMKEALELLDQAQNPPSDVGGFWEGKYLWDREEPQ